MTEHHDVDPFLSTEQQERVEALQAAAKIMAESDLTEYGSNDIIDLAFWIHTGIDPSDTRLDRRQRLNPFPDAAEWTPEDQSSG